ncbi:MAG: (Fe-S)-binding protein [Gammaproteobacteria bacterium]
MQTPRRLLLLRTLLRLYQDSGLQFIARTSGVLNLLKLKTTEQLLPEINKATTFPEQKAFPAKVALFTGCSQTLFDSEVIAATIKLLNALGIEVIIPAQQTCCGALHNLQGEYQQAASLINNNENVFAQQGIDTVLYLSTGCGVFIKENYASSVAFREITEYITSQLLSNLAFKSLEKTVAVHVPCTQTNVLHQADTTTPLIKNIPGIKLVSLAQHGCCGAGGTTMLKYPDMASEIRQPLLDKVIQDQCGLVVTTNPGCQLHLQAGFKNEKSMIKVMHPVTLLAQQLAECDLGDKRKNAE